MNTHTPFFCKALYSKVLYTLVILLTTHYTSMAQLKVLSNGKVGVRNRDGNICDLGGLGNFPNMFIANNITSPASGCGFAFVPFGKVVIFVGHNSVTLNGGFEVVLGASFSAF
jgi:hypothetical protein